MKHFRRLRNFLKNLKNEILNDYILSIYSTLSFQVILCKLMVIMIVIEVINETIIYLYFHIFVYFYWIENDIFEFFSTRLSHQVTEAWF